MSRLLYRGQRGGHGHGVRIFAIDPGPQGPGPWALEDRASDSDHQPGLLVQIPMSHCGSAPPGPNSEAATIANGRDPV